MVGKEVGEELEGVKRSKKYNQNILYKKMSFKKKKSKDKGGERERRTRERGRHREREEGR